ncbi:S1 family peptidase [Paenibacillus marinisediminis]
MNNSRTSSEPVDDTEAFIYEIEEEDELDTPTQRTWITKSILILLAVLLVGNLIAFIPQIYNLPALRFLSKDSQLSQDELIQQYKQAVVAVSAGDRKGTGFNIAANGLIITNQHVMADDQAGTIQFLHGETYLADVIVIDKDLDIAILKIRDNMSNLPALQLETETSYLAGDPVYVIGNPLSFFHIAIEGTLLGLTPTENRELPMLMLQAPIHNGNSGSPVINNKGHVIAVVFATTTTTQGDQSVTVGLAIPIDYLQKYEKFIYE